MKVIGARVDRDTVRGRPSLLVTVRDDAGHVGIGEATPLPGYSPEDFVTAAGALTDVAGRLSSLELDEPAAVAALAPLESSLTRAPSARFALESALFDLLGCASGKPLHVLLGGSPTPNAVATSALLSSPLDVTRTLAEAATLLARGITTVKAKIARPGVAWAAELGVLASLRARFPALALRLDANGAWSIDEARSRLRELATVAPAYVEEPTRGLDLLALGATAVPWAADESLVDRTLAFELLACPSCVAFVLKPALLGGLVRARELALRAIAQGKVAVITHMMDGAVARAALAGLVLSLPAPVAACGLEASTAAEALGVAALAQSGRVIATDLPGLGLARRRAWTA